MAVAYFKLQNSDRSLYYLDKLRERGVKTTDSRLMYAYIKQGQNEEGAFYKEMRELKRVLRIESEEDPGLRQDPGFMQDYLTVRMFFINSEQFERELREAKPLLEEQAYMELLIAWALRGNIDEQIHHLSKAFKRPEPWLRLNMAIAADDRASQQHILQRYYRILPARDRVQTAQNVGQLSLAQELAFKGLSQNRKDEMLYENMRQLHNTYADHFLIEAGHLSRSGLSQSYSDLHNSYYLARAYTLQSDLFWGNNSANDEEVFKSVPGSSRAFGLGIKKQFDRGSYQIDAGIRESADQYNYLSFKYRRMISEGVNIELLVDKAAVAEESVYLLTGGYKDRIALQTSYSLLGSTQLGLYLEKADYASQDGTDIGSGISGRFDYSYLQRSAYPDISITPYYSFGSYEENEGSKGVIDAMLTFPDTKVISDDFWYTGVDFSYGMENRYNFVRVWRPFFSLNPYYNGRESQFNYGFSAGLGGEVLGQDNLAFIVDYSESVGGTDDTLWRSYFRYKILY